MVKNNDQKTDWMDVAAFSLGTLGLALSVYDWLVFPSNEFLIWVIVCGLASLAAYRTSKIRKGFGKVGAIQGGMGILLQVLSHLI